MYLFSFLKIESLKSRETDNYSFGNIYPVKVDGSFDDCQKMVKEALTDNDLRSKFNFTTANSINISRWIPQILYYFFAYKELIDSDKNIAVSIPWETLEIYFHV